MIQKWLVSSGGAGFIRPAPGTWGALAALPMAIPVAGLTGNPLWLMPLSGCLFILGLWACQPFADDDHGWIVIDETAAQLLVLAFVPLSWLHYALAFALFRFFDIVKPFPVGWVDRKIKGAVGIMLDDMVAALLAVAALTVLSRTGML
jgi:phosphatidylglycerophosphatase A